jgi:hypothetical protein
MSEGGMDKGRGEERQKRFLRVAERRANRILDAIYLLRKTANRQAYLYDEDQVKTIFSEIRSELDAAEADFFHTKKRRISLKRPEEKP